MSSQPERTPVGVGFTPFESRLDVIDQVTAHAERRGFDFVPRRGGDEPRCADRAGRLAERTHRTPPVTEGFHPRVLRAHGYRRELDALLEANVDPRQPVLPTAATRLAEDVLMSGTHADAPRLLRHWSTRADSVALVAPFGVSPDDIVATLDGIGPTDR